MSTSQDTIMDMNLRIINYDRMIYKHINTLNIKYDREDFLQIGRLAVYQALNVADNTDSLNEASLVYGLIRNRLIDEIRKRQKYQLEVSDEIQLNEKINFDDNEYREWMYVLKEMLTEKEYQCLELTLAGYKQSDIASRINRSPSMVKQYRRNIREKVGRSDTW